MADSTYDGLIAATRATRNGGVTVGLIVRAGMVVDCAPYVRRWALNMPARVAWRRLEAEGYTVVWRANEGL